MTTSTLQCIVTGGAGFIGSHLVGRLLGLGHHVLVLDDFSSGRRKNLEEFKNDSRLSVRETAVSDLDAIQKLFLNADWVFHLAAKADIIPSIEHPVSYHQSNVDGTISVLEAARLAGVKRFIYAASSSCYGLPDKFPTLETASVRPLYPYALTKWIGEQYVMHWNKVYKLPAVSLRLFNVYGPRARTTGAYGAVFGVFLAQKLAGKPFTVVGDGKQTRDFTYVTDVVDAFLAAANSNVEGEVFNVGSGKPQSVNSLVELLGGEAVHLPKRPGEPDCTWADIKKIKEQLGWVPKVSFEEGVRLMLKGIEMWKDAPVWDKVSIAHATKKWFEYLGNPASSIQKD